MKKIIGIDYGSQLAGTTVICVLHEVRGVIEEIDFFQSEKKKKADAFLTKVLNQLEVQEVFIDAPLSLPGVYRDMEGKSDYFYRKCDRELNCMSPLFIGGLTARAMRLAANLELQFHEVYPSAKARKLNLGELNYKKKKDDIETCVKKIMTSYQFDHTPEITNWHAFDALLASLIGLDHKFGEAKIFGDKKEGLIFV